jgi:very-short-patch-repair endonuclease
VSDTSSLGLRSCGVWTRAEALAVLGRGQVDALVRSRTWQVPWRGVYADAGHDLDAEQRAWAAVLAVGGPRRPAAACGRTAARVWELPLVDDLDPATQGQEHLLDEVAVARRLPRQRWSGRVLRPMRTSLVSAEVVRLPSGLWVTSVLRTLVDCAGLLAGDALVCALDAALHRGLVTDEDLDAAVRARAGQAHVLALAAAVRSADGRAESPAETLARLLLQPALPGLEPQVELFDDVGRTVARFDLGDRETRLAAECDGKVAHAGAAMVAKDRDRDRRTEVYGWRTERITWFELRRQQAAVLRRITDVHAARAAQP